MDNRYNLLKDGWHENEGIQCEVYRPVIPEAQRKVITSWPYIVLVL